MPDGTLYAATTPACGAMYEGRFSDALLTFVRGRAGKALLLSDGVSYGALAPHSLAPRTLFLVLDGDDALPLFALPDEIACVAAVGGATVMRVARFFAEVRGIPCLLAPTDAMQDGVYERRAYVTIDGVPSSVFLKNAQTVCDETLFASSLNRAAYRVLLARLALLEGRALARFSGEEASPFAERAYAVLSAPQSVLQKNAALRRLECEGLSCGEGVPLAALLSCENPEYAAYRALYALYRAFFVCGKPRRYVAPDYRARAARAGVPYAAIAIPTEAEYARRALALERMRGACADELARINREGSAELAYAGGLPDPARLKDALFSLPERGGGLTAVIRDFGLMEDI